MDVVTARVHDTDFRAAVVFGSYGARVRKPGLFLDGQCVELGAEHDHGSVAVLQHADDAGAADPSRDLVPELAEARRELRGRACLVR